ncbi:hypothetical protein [Hymenobacter psychrophilus]|uniref:Uncharacterized protein n=1 Tax=Hymenobacter psychrophilus TaxID=651662 RepID=A0A1H3NIY9_9BACT|nr:hypothetical protein [Hymenobacter psychrophilus]SDY88896.1 hypothetical protein SAMN04488069_11732 [Hymenobacter psychrophilus]
MKVFLFLLGLLSAQVATADSWELPKTTRYHSPDSSWFVEVVPLHIPAKYYAYHGTKPRRRHKFTAADTVIIPCHATMFRLQGSDTIKVWEKQLINRIAPVSALVSTNGRYLVTVDNWSSMGYGVDVLAVYDVQGNLLKRYALEDFSPFPINTYWRSISSLWWNCGVEWQAPYTLDICFQDEQKQEKHRTYNLETMQFGP